MRNLLVRAAALVGLLFAAAHGPAVSDTPPKAPTKEVVATFDATSPAVATVTDSVVLSMTPVPAQPALLPDSSQQRLQARPAREAATPRMRVRRRKLYGRWYKFYHLPGEKKPLPRADLPIDPGRSTAGK